MTTQKTAQRLTLVTLVVLALGLTGFLVYRQFAPEPAAADVSGELELDGQPMLGEPDAPVAIAVFEDFKCPFCAQFDEEVLPQLEREFVDTGRARVYFVNFAFIAPDSTTAAIAGECVFNQDPAAFWDFKTAVFRSQGPESEAWATPAFLADLARNNFPDLDADALQSCTEDETFAENVAADRDLAAAVEVQATPSVFVNGVLQEGSSYPTIAAAVEAAGGAEAN